MFKIGRSSLHFLDTEVSPTTAEINKLWKAEPASDTVLNQYRKLERQAGCYPVNEKIITSTGISVLRQHVIEKHRPVGLTKNIVIAASGVTVMGFEIHQGKSTL